MDIRKAMRPRVATDASSVGNVGPKFVSGEEVKANTTIASHPEVTPQAGNINLTQDTKEYTTTDEVIQAHKDFLETRGIDEVTIMSVLDMLVSGQVVLWQFELLGKIPVTFRVRPQWVDKFLIEEMERLRPTNIARFTDLIGTINLSGSLEKYGDKSFRATTVDDLKIVSDFLSSLPFVIQNKLVDELAVFDRVLVVATSDWAVKNFTEPR